MKYIKDDDISFEEYFDKIVMNENTEIFDKLLEQARELRDKKLK
jgi:hypothetical protein